MADDLKHKDINDMIISALTSEQITDIIHNNTFSGLGATLNLIFIRECKYDRTNLCCQEKWSW